MAWLTDATRLTDWLTPPPSITHTTAHATRQLTNQNTDKLHTELKDMHRLFGSVLAFIIAFRTNNAYQSYVEGAWTRWGGRCVCLSSYVEGACVDLMVGRGECLSSHVEGAWTGWDGGGVCLLMTGEA